MLVLEQLKKNKIIVLGFYIKDEKKIVTNKEAILKSGRKGYAYDEKYNDNPNIVIIRGYENSKDLIEIIMNNESEHRLSICLLIFVTKNVFFNSLVKETFIELKELDNNLYKELKKEIF